MPPGPEAWHEAGHALAAHLLGGIVREVTLESELEGFERLARVADALEAHVTLDAALFVEAVGV